MISSNTTRSQWSVNKLLVTGAILIFLTPPILAIVIQGVLRGVLSPADGSLGLAFMNISTLSLSLICILTGVSMVVVALGRSVKKK